MRSKKILIITAVAIALAAWFYFDLGQLLQFEVLQQRIGDLRAWHAENPLLAGLISASFGLWQGSDGGDSVELNDPDRYRYLNLQFEDDVLVGANSLGLTQHVGVLRGLIQTRLHLGKWKAGLMENPLNVMEAYLSATQGSGTTAKVL